MNIKDLQYFYELSKIQSVTLVAKQFEVSQPTISYAVKRLEAEFDCDLVKKDNPHRQTELTRQGLQFAKRAKNILNELELAQREMATSKKVKIGLPNIIRSLLITRLMHEQENIQFLSNFFLLSQGSKQLLQHLTNGSLDFSFLGTIEDFHHPNIIFNPFYESPFYILLAKDHPLADRPSLSFADVLDDKLILLGNSTVHYEAYRKLSQKYSRHHEPYLTIDDPALIGQLVSENMGVSLMVDYPLVSHKDIAFIPLDVKDQITFTAGYAYPKDVLLDPRILNFIDVLERNRQYFQIPLNETRPIED